MAGRRSQFVKEFKREWCLSLTENVPGSVTTTYTTPEFKPLMGSDITFCLTTKFKATKYKNEFNRFQVVIDKFHEEEIPPTLSVSAEVAAKFPNNEYFYYFPTKFEINVKTMKRRCSFGEISLKNKISTKQNFTIKCGLRFYEDISESDVSNQCGVNITSVNSTSLHVTQDSNEIALKTSSPANCDSNVVALKSSSYVQCESGTTVSTMLPDLTKNFKSVYTPNVFGDIVFKVEQQSLAAHKGIVAAHSPVLQKILTHDLSKSKTNSVTITDTTAQTFDQFLKYLYIYEIEDKSWPAVKELYYLADKYHVEI